MTSVPAMVAGRALPLTFTTWVMPREAGIPAVDEEEYAPRARGYTGRRRALQGPPRSDGWSGDEV